MGTGSDNYLVHPAKQFLETRGAGKVSAQHQNIGKESNQPLGLHLVATGRSRAHDNVLLSGIAVEQHLERCQQRHEEGHSLLTAQRLKCSGQVLRQHL